MQRPYYFPPDVYALLCEGDPAQFCSDRVVRLLSSMRDTGRVHQAYLSAFPVVKCQPLAFFYQCRRAIDAMDARLFDDLIHCHGAPEAGWAIWLAALAPRAAWVDTLRAQRQRLPEHGATIDLALHAAGDIANAPDARHAALLGEVRALLAMLAPIPFPMRLTHPASQQAALDAEMAAVRSAYREGGLAAALPLARQGLLGFYGQTHAAWIAADPCLSLPPAAGVWEIDGR